jgi:transcriptional regulator with XRE-family HTH domain
MQEVRATRPISEELPKLMKERGWRPLDVYAHGGPTPATTSRYEHEKRGLVAESRVIKTLRKFEEAFELPEGYFLEEQIGRAEGELRTLAREGFVSLADMESLIKQGRRAKETAQVPRRSDIS